MFKLESYVAPLLISYINKYVKLNKDDFKMSLWGGDVVLNKLELRLDVIENLIKIPISLKSGWVHELRVHVPWTHLYSEPVVITINTIECSVKLKNGESSSDSTSLSSRQSSISTIKKAKSMPIIEGQQDLPPPGYLQSLLNKIVNNINIIVNNLILKFVDDDIVLSLNVKSAECFSANAEWNRSFIELVPEDLILRRVLEIHDLTLCLDQRSASGKIEHYQTPVLYRCVLRARLALVYESLYSKLPCLTKLNVVCDTFNVSFTDIQIPMFERLLKLLNFYFESSNINDCSNEVREDCNDMQGDALEKMEDLSDQDWASWAWSYVPPIFLNSQESDPDIMQDTGKKNGAILIIGFHIRCMLIHLKHSVISRTRGQIGFEKMSFVPYMLMNLESLNLDMRFKDNSFIDVQFGISNMKSYFQCDCLTDLSDEKVNESKVMQFFEGGESVFSVTTYSQFHKSLFSNDYEIESFPTSEDEHILMFSEDYARNNFSFFWMNFVSTIQIEDEGNATNDHSSLNELDFKERLLHRFYVGKSELKFTTRLFNISNHLCALLSNNELCATTGFVEPKPSEGDISHLEPNAVSSRYFISFFYPKIYFYPVDTELFDHKCQWQNYLSKVYKSLGFTSQGSRRSGIPVIVSVCERLDFVYSMLGYPNGGNSIFEELSEQDLKKCYSSLYVKVDRLNVHLQLMDHGNSEKKCVIQPMNLKLQQKSLTHCNFWKESLQPESDWLLKGENLTFNLTKPQICVISYIFGSWIFQPADHKAFDSLSLINDVFYEKSPLSLPSIEVTIPSFEFHYMENKALHAFSGCITSILVLMLSCENEKQILLPLLYGPLDLTELSDGSNFFSDSSKPNECLGDLITISCQIDKNSMLTEVYQGVFIKILGISVLLDPILYDWLSYLPKQLFQRMEESIMLDAEVLLATDPLNSSCFGSESGSHNMEQATAMTNFNDSKLPDLNYCHRYFTTIYHLLKSLEVEIKVGNSCLFMPSQYIYSTSPTVNIPVMLRSLYNSGSLPEVFVIVFPKIDITSMGSSMLVSPPPIPMTTHSVTGEKLPWKLILSSMSMYSVHGSGMVISFMDSLTICSTMALNLVPLETEHASDMVMYHKSLCLHCDTDLAHFSLCSKQIVLFEDLLKKLGTAMKDNVETVNCLVSLLNIKRSSLRNNFSLANPSQSYQDMANTSEGLSDDLSFHIKDEQTLVQDKVSVWLQFTISKLVLEIPHREQFQRESVLECEIIDIANSLDISGSCVNFKSKINSICVKEIFGQRELILMVTEVCLPQHLMFALASKVSSKGNATHIGNACHASSVSKETEFLNFSFTRVHENSLFNRFVKDRENKMLKLLSQNLINGNMSNIDEVCINLQPFVTFLDFESLLAITNFIEILSDFANLFGDASSPTGRNIEDTFNTSDLPLIHLSIKCFYAFFHEKHNGSNFSTDEENVEDTLVVYVDYFAIVPYADNPLPRLVVDKNLYAKVIQLEEFGSTPGCLLENRQYQAHVQGLTFASTNWKNILKESKFKSDLLLSSDVQNPALEWNSNLRSSNIFYVGLLTSALSIQIIFAPAIVCHEAMNPEKKLVCGYSLEISLISELEITLTISRISLLVGLVNGAIELSSKYKSGFRIGMKGIASHKLPKTSPVSSVVPFDLLVTGIRLNAAFMHENLKCASSQNKYRNSSEFTVTPILCCLISQPYFIFKYGDRKTSKLEVSCYDASIKSGNPTSPNNIRFMNVCPSYSDFVDFMLETKQGKPDDTTGVLSSLFTCTISNYLCDEAEIVVKIERPVKISYTNNHHEMISNFISELWDCLEVSKYKHEEILTLEHADALNTYNSLKWLKSASCTAGQLVLQWIIELGESKTVLRLSTKNLNFNVIPQNMKKMSCNGLLTNLALTVSTKEQMFRIFGPSTIKAQLVLHSYEISQMPRNPNCLFIRSIDIHLCFEIITLQFSKASVKCLNEILKHLSLGTGNDSNDDYQSESSDIPINESYGLLSTEYENDLKSNLLSFVHKEDCGVPACGEITFQTDICCSAMTWKYHEPRIISKLTVIPIPFQIDESFIKNANKEFEGISCILQYSLDDGINFRNYTTFEVGRNVFVEISLPSTSDSCLVASCIWKVLLIKDAGNHDQYETIDESQRNRNVLSPLILASCLKIYSKIIPHLIPTMTLTVSSEKLETILNYSEQNKSKEKSGGKKYDSLPNHRVAILGCRASSIYFQTFLGDTRNTIKLDVVSELELQIIEYINLTWSKIFREMLFESNVLIDKKNSLIELACNINKSHVMISQEVGHTLDLIYNLWNETPNFSYIASCCLIHNNTQEELYFGQVGTEEMLILPPMCIYQYFWSCLYRSKELWIGIEKYQKEIQNSLVVDRNSPLKKIELSDGRTLCANFDGNFKIEIEGNLTFGNSLDFGIYIKIELEGTSKIKKMNPKELLPSFVLVETKLEKVKISVSLNDSETWSEEIILGTHPKKHLIEMLLNSRRIHIWCEILIQNGPDKLEYLVLFSPLFVVRSHYPLRLLMNVSLTKSMNSFQIGVGGKGKMTMLHCSRDFPLHITLQLHPEISPSKPILEISSKMATDVIEQDFKGKWDIRHIIHEWDNNTMIYLDQWPYNAIDESVLSCTQSSSLNCLDECVDRNFPIPNIELSINLSQYASYSNTLMVELAPQWMIINETNLDLIIYHCNSSEFWSILSSKAFVPPIMEQFSIMLLIGGTLHSSDTITLLKDELSSPYQSSDDLHLAVESHATFSIPVVCNGKIKKKVYLTIHSTWKHNMRIITIKEQFIFVNNLPYIIQLLGVVCCKNQTQIEVDESTQPTDYINMSVDKQEVIQSMLMWNFHDFDESLPQTETSFVICMRLSSTKDVSNFAWSSPICLEVGLETSCHRVVVPCNENILDYHELMESAPCCVTVRVEKCLVYLVLDFEKQAYLRVHNSCHFPLYMASPQASKVVSKKTISSQATIVKANSSGYFCPSLISQSTTFFPFAVIIGSLDPVNSDVVWSLPFEIHESLTSSIIKLGKSDIKIELKIKGLLCYINLSSLMRANVLEVKKVTQTDSSYQQFSKCQVKLSSLRHVDTSDRLNLPGSFKIKVAILCKSLFWTLIDDTFKCFSTSEIATKESQCLLLLAMDDVFLLVKSLDNDNLEHSMYHLEISIGDVQIDNKAFDDGSFDFPVIMLRSQEGHTYRKCQQIYTPYEAFKYPLKNVLFRISSRFVVIPKFQVLNLSLCLLPFALSLEDTFIFRFIEYIWSFKDYFKSYQCNSRKISYSLVPADVRLISNDFANPIRLQRLLVEPVRVLLSIHASLKIFVAVDSTPMNFGKFERVDILLTKQQLSKLLTMHYASSALLRAGVIIGSLEILGNPTGFVRNITNGVFDMIFLPYNGLALGPASCIVGFSNGIKSVVKHFSAGTFTSISNFASGISRNMERLSMDEDHIDRFERMRRRKPRGLTQGLSEGLAGFGLSLLGAIAGLADQPLQVFMGQERLSVSSWARGIVAGIGKGLIGVIAKPIGGAAELVSMTSIGFMHGAGLIELYQQRDYNNFPNEFQMALFNQVILTKKNMLKFPDEDFLCSLDGCSMGLHNPCAIILTSSVIHVWNCSENFLLCSFPISDVHLTVDYGSSELFLFVTKLGEHHSPYLAQGSIIVPSTKSDNERVAEYMSRNHLFTSSSLCSSSCSTKMKLKYTFHFQDKHSTAEFLSMFEYAFLNKDTNHFLV